MYKFLFLVILYSVMWNKYFSKIIIIFTIVSVVVSCNDTQEEVQRESAQKRQKFVADSLAFKVGVMPTSDCETIIYASNNGVFDSLGVNVKLYHYKSLSECRNAMKQHIVEGVAVDSTLAQIIATKDSVDLFLGSPTSLTWKLVSGKKARIVRTSQLVDKIIAADSHGNSRQFAEQCVDSVLKKGKLVFFVQVEDVGVRYDMLRLGNVDAAVLPEPYATMAIRNGNNLLVDGTGRSKGVMAFRKEVKTDDRRSKQYELFLKALDVARIQMTMKK